MLRLLFAGSHTERERDGLLLNYTGTQNQSGPTVCCYGNARLNTFLVAGWYQTELVLSPCPLYPAEREREGERDRVREREAESDCVCVCMYVYVC